MTKEKRQRVRFTGKRTGLESISISGVGFVKVGDVIEVSEEEGENWTAELPLGDGNTASDFTKVGGVYSLEEGELAKRRMMQTEKYAPDPEDVLPAEVVTAAAHESADTGTVEEYAEQRDEEMVTPDEIDKPAGKRGKK